MPQQLARILRDLEPRLSQDIHNDPWSLVWMLAVGATYSLGRAQPLLPGAATDFRRDALAIVRDSEQGRATDLGTYPTWALGFYLNSTEARIQAALHRLLKAYTSRGGWAFQIIEEIERRQLGDRPPRESMSILGRVRQGFAEDEVPGAALARCWDRSNSVKHDPAQDVSDQFNFQRRWNDCRTAIEEILRLIDLLGTHCGGIAAA